MKERPIIFSGESVRSILAGTKTQTRRVVKPQPPGPPTSALRHPARHPGPYFDSYCSEPKTLENPRGMSDLWCWWTADDRCDPETRRCPYGVPGDRLWVRETWQCEASGDFEHPRYRELEDGSGVLLYYRADDSRSDGWRSPIHMPRWASRLTLEVTDVCVQRLQEITDWQILAEGMPAVSMPRGCPLGIAWFHERWDALNGKRAPWAINPFVWVLTFRRLP